MRRGCSGLAVLLALAGCGGGGIEAGGRDGPGPGADGPARDTTAAEGGGGDAAAADASGDAAAADASGDAAEVWTVPVAELERTAVAFDGADDYYSFGKSRRLRLEAGDAVTIAGWVNPSSLDGYDPILGRPAPCANAGNYLVDLLGGLRFCYQGAAAGHCARISSTVPVGEWTHFAVTYRFGDAASLRGYTNGVLTNSGNWYYGTGAEAPQTSADHAVHAGNFAGCTTGAEYFFHGRLARLVLYDRVLAEDEIRRHARAEVPLPCTDIADEARPLELTLLDGAATGYGTFQSFNQKVVADEDGLFTTHIRTRNEAYTAQTWRLSRSLDDGASFTTILEETIGTNPPVLELDLDGNLYAMRQDYPNADSYLYTFPQAAGYASHTALTIPAGGSGKYAMLYDWIRHRLYYFSHYGSFYVIEPGGAVLATLPLIVSGTSADPQYPLLAMDEFGTIFAAWTNVKHGEYMYWSIHAIRSVDGGASWQKLDGTPLATPMACDESGPADRLTLSDEYNFHTWLWSFLAKNHKIHFAYLAQTTPARQHYVRYDASSGHEDLRIQPEWRGSAIALASLDGFVVADPWSPRRLFWVSHTVDTNAIGVLQSIDDGATWHDFAITSAPVGVPYSIGGFREVTSRGYLVGTYTDVEDAVVPKVQFLRALVRTPTDPLICL